METYDYSNPVRLLYGKDRINLLGELIIPYGKKVLLVYGQKHLKETGTYSKIISILGSKGIKVFDLEGVQPNPRISLVNKGIESLVLRLLL